MREFEARFREGLLKGLRVEANNPRYNESLVECYNLKPHRFGLVPFEPLEADPTGHTEACWPYVQFFAGAKFFVYACGKDVYVYDHFLNLKQSITVIPGDRWCFADFGDYFIMVNGLQVVQIDPDGNLEAFVLTETIPRCLTLCNYRGQLFGGGVKTDWYEKDENSAIWSRIGRVDFTINHDNESGFIRLPTVGNILRCMVLGNHVIYYGTTGVYAVSPETTNLKLTHLFNRGIKWKANVDGDETQHLMVSDDGTLYKIHPDLKIERLGYREWISRLNLDWTVVSYDSRLREFYICDVWCREQVVRCEEIDYKCYLLNDYGLCSVHQYPTSIAVVDGVSYGTFIDNYDHSFSVETDTFDFNQRSLKTIMVMEFAGNYSGNIMARLKWQDTYRVGQDYFKQRPFKRLNPQGILTLPTSGMDFRISFYGADYEMVDNLDYIITRVKLTDRRMIRGMYATTESGNPVQSDEE